MPSRFYPRSPSFTYGFLFLGSFDSTATLLTVTLSGSNHSLCSEFIDSAKSDMLDNLIFGATGKTALFFDPSVYILSFYLSIAGTPYCFGALLISVFPPVRSFIFFILDRKVILLYWCTVSSSLMALLHL